MKYLHLRKCILAIIFLSGRSHEGFYDFSRLNGCNLKDIYGCVVNITKGYNLKIPNKPDIRDGVPISLLANKSRFIKLCSDYKKMRRCLKQKTPCDYRGKMYKTYSLALAEGLDNACLQSYIEGYDDMVRCFQLPEIEETEKNCSETLIEDVRKIFRKVEVDIENGQHDAEVTIENVCYKYLESIYCIVEKLSEKCGQSVAKWYNDLLLRAINPTLQTYKCRLFMPLSGIFVIAFVSTVAAGVVGFASYECFKQCKISDVRECISSCRTKDQPQDKDSKQQDVFSIVESARPSTDS